MEESAGRASLGEVDKKIGGQRTLNPIANVFSFNFQYIYIANTQRLNPIANVFII